MSVFKPETAVHFIASVISGLICLTRQRWPYLPTDPKPHGACHSLKLRWPLKTNILLKKHKVQLVYSAFKVSTRWSWCLQDIDITCLCAKILWNVFSVLDRAVFSALAYIGGFIKMQHDKMSSGIFESSSHCFKHTSAAVSMITYAWVLLCHTGKSSRFHLESKYTHWFSLIGNGY